MLYPTFMADGTEKACVQCGQVQSLDDGFYRSKRNSDGRDSYCKGCRNGRHAKWVAQHREPPRPKPTEKRCTACGEIKPLSAFWSSGKGKRSPTCKPCKTAYHYEYIARPEVAARIKEQDRNRRSGKWKRPPRREPIADGYEVCTMCNEDKPLEDFHVHKLGRNGRDSVCRRCKAARSRERNADPSAKERSYRLKLRRDFGLELGRYDEMLEEQDGRCAICRREPNGKRLHVDHCHTTGVVRGLLCYTCNVGLGNFNDDPDRLQVAIEYLLNSRKE